MAAPARTPRNTAGIVIIGLVFGAVPLMLWMGRWKLALGYLVLGLVLMSAFFGAAVSGLLPMAPFASFDPATALYVPYLPLMLAAVIHAALIQGVALDRPWYSRLYVALPGLAVLCLAVAFGIRTFLLHPFNAPSLSMEPSLMQGDSFFVSKTAYASRDPRRGEIAVFRLPSDDTTVYVKRVVGLSGERLQVTDGVLHINGVAVKLEPVQLPDMFHAEGKPSYFRETLPEGRSYVIANGLDGGNADDTDEYNVPARHYFVMGDNRDNSQDSRYLDAVGYVPAENFIGPVVFRFWNSHGVPLDNRPEEIFVQP